MGLPIFGGRFSDSPGSNTSNLPSSSCDVAKSTAPNPNPYRFKVIEERHVGGCAIVKIRYPDCTTFGGHKVLVYDDVEKWTALKNTGVVDPHFLEGSYSPIARFEGSLVGWMLAAKLVEALTGHA
jgi:hypothetical protein